MCSAKHKNELFQVKRLLICNYFIVASIYFFFDSKVSCLSRKVNFNYFTKLHIKRDKTKLHFAVLFLFSFVQITKGSYF